MNISLALQAIQRPSAHFTNLEDFLEEIIFLKRVVKFGEIRDY